MPETHLSSSNSINNRFKSYTNKYSKMDKIRNEIGFKYDFHMMIKHEILHIWHHHL